MSRDRLREAQHAYRESLPLERRVRVETEDALHAMRFAEFREQKTAEAARVAQLKADRARARHEAAYQQLSGTAGPPAADITLGDESRSLPNLSDED